MKQNYSNHVRVYAPHQYFFGPATLLLAIFAFYKFGTSLQNPSDTTWIWFVLGLGMILMLYLSIMMRVHYALTLQNRIIYHEMNFRYFRLTGKSIEESGMELTDKQIIALRFAPDHELQELTEKAASAQLSPDDIKKSIRDWKADLNRV